MTCPAGSGSGVAPIGYEITAALTIRRDPSVSRAELPCAGRPTLRGLLPGERTRCIAHREQAGATGITRGLHDELVVGSHRVIRRHVAERLEPRSAERETDVTSNGTKVRRPI